MRENREGDGRRGEGWGWERKQHSIAKRPKDTKGRRMTSTRVKPGQRNEEERDRKMDGGWKRRFKPRV